MYILFENIVVKILELLLMQIIFSFPVKIIQPQIIFECQKFQYDTSRLIKCQLLFIFVDNRITEKGKN